MAILVIVFLLLRKYEIAYELITTEWLQYCTIINGNIIMMNIYYKVSLVAKCPSSVLYGLQTAHHYPFQSCGGYITLISAQ